MNTLSEDQLINAGVNNDKVNSIDFGLLRKYLLGFIDSFNHTNRNLELNLIKKKAKVALKTGFHFHLLLKMIIT